jgi:hypothetical protein
MTESGEARVSLWLEIEGCFYRFRNVFFFFCKISHVPLFDSLQYRGRSDLLENGLGQS